MKQLISAVCNFTPSSAQIEAASSLPYPFLDLTIGDEVHLLAEEEGTQPFLDYL